MLNLYALTPERLSKAEGKSFVTYGITVYKNTKKIMYVSDISTKFFFVLFLCVKFTAYQLSPLHLRDVLSDML